MWQVRSHISDMTETTSTYPYILEVEPNPRAEGVWRWAIRQHGKLVRRIDRAAASETKARAQGMEAIAKLLQGGNEGRF